MRKDIDLGKAEYAKHSRNSALGKAGANRVARHNVKQNIAFTDLSAAPKKKYKGKKKWVIKSGHFCDCYDTEKARDQAFDKMITDQKRAAQAPSDHWWSRLRIRNVEKVER